MSHQLRLDSLCFLQLNSEDPCIICHEDMVAEERCVLECRHSFHSQVSRSQLRTYYLVKWNWVIQRLCLCSVYQAMAEATQHLSNLQTSYLVARGFSCTVHQKTQGSMTSLYSFILVWYFTAFSLQITRGLTLTLRFLLVNSFNKAFVFEPIFVTEI